MQTILTVSEMRQSDANTIKNGICSFELMGRAGKAVLNKTQEIHPFSKKDRIAVLAGKGGNGGDGCVIAHELHLEGYDVTLYTINKFFSDTANYYYGQCKIQGLRIEQFTRETDLSGYNLIFDCIFGTGFKGAPKDDDSGFYNTAISEINHCGSQKKDISKPYHIDSGNMDISIIHSSGSYVVSVDINSGLNGDNGTLVNAVKSDLTVSIGSPQPGLFLNNAKDYVKKIVSADIGLLEENHHIFLMERQDIKKLLFNRLNATSKADYGYICLVAGCFNYSGAAKLSAMSSNVANMALEERNSNSISSLQKLPRQDISHKTDSLQDLAIKDLSLQDLSSMLEASGRSGSGVVTLASPKVIANAVSPFILESTLYPLTDNGNSLVFNESEFDYLCSKYRTIAFGMGLGNTEEVQKALTYILKNFPGTLLIDADGLNALSVIGVSRLTEAKCKIVLTPHTSEFSRLIKKDKSEIIKEPIALSEQFAKENRVTLLLKGPSTIITDGEITYIVDKGCSGMATAGSGDVLSGVITSLLGYSKESVLLTAAAGAYITGLAGELAQRSKGDISLLARDTVARIPEAILSIRN